MSKGKKKKKTKTKAQKAAAARHAKFKQTRVQTFGGKRTNFSKAEQTRIKDAGYSVKGYSQAAPNKASGYSGTTGVSVGSTIKNPNPPKSGMLQKQKAAIKSGDYDFGPAPKPKVSQVTMMDETGQRYGGVVKDGVPQFKTPDGKTPTIGGYTPTMPGLAKSLGIDPKTGLDSEGKGPSFMSTKSPESFGAPSQEAVDKAAGITAGGLNIGGGGFTPSKPSGGANARAIFPGASPNSVLNDPNFTPGPVAGDPFAQPGPGGPEPEADYTSYQPGSFYNQSDTNMNPTNFLRSARNVVTTPARMLGINNRFTNMLIPKSNEAIQDARDQRGPRPTLTRRRSSGGGARLPVAPLTPEEILEEQYSAQTAPTYQQAQTGVDPNRLMQIQQNAYLQAFNPAYNAMFRFFDGGRGARRGRTFRQAFRRD